MARTRVRITSGVYCSSMHGAVLPTPTQLTLQMSSLTATCRSVEHRGAARGGEVPEPASAFSSASSAAAAPSCASVRAFWKDLWAIRVRVRVRFRSGFEGSGQPAWGSQDRAGGSVCRDAARWHRRAHTARHWWHSMRCIIN